MAPKASFPLVLIGFFAACWRSYSAVGGSPSEERNFFVLFQALEDLDVFEDEDAGSEGRFGLDVFAVVEDLL
jgi:hypothetical protein